MSVTEKLHEALRKRLEEETLYRVAKDSGVNYATLDRFMRKEGNANSVQIDKLAAYLGLTLCDDEDNEESTSQ